VGYDPGPASIFRNATASDRYLLALKGAGHAIGTDPPPAAMRGTLWDFDWFERSHVAQAAGSMPLHCTSFTAFLDLHKI